MAFESRLLNPNFNSSIYPTTEAGPDAFIWML